MANNEREIEIPDCPSNSHKSKGERVRNSEEKSHPPDKPEERKVQQITTGKVTQRKKSLGKKFTEAFLGDNMKSVGDYIIQVVIVPTVKATINEMISGGLEMLLYGERRGRNIRRDGSKSQVSYGAYYRNTDRERDKTRELPRTVRTQHDFNDLIFESRGEAEQVLEKLVDDIIDYGMCTVGNLYDLVGVTSEFTDDKYGWTDLRSASVNRVRDGYILNLPRPRQLD